MLYGADLDTMRYGSGFPLTAAARATAKGAAYGIDAKGKGAKDSAKGAKPKEAPSAAS